MYLNDLQRHSVINSFAVPIPFLTGFSTKICWAKKLHAKIPLLMPLLLPWVGSLNLPCGRHNFRKRLMPQIRRDLGRFHDIIAGQCTLVIACPFSDAPKNIR